MRATRRELMMGCAGAAAIAASPTSLSAAQAASPMPAPRRPTIVKPDGRLAVDRERASRMMKAAGVDLLVGAGEINSRYLTNMRSLYTDMGRPHRIIGVMSADPAKPIVAILPSAFDIARHSQPDRQWPELVTYSAPLALSQYVGQDRVGLDVEVEPVPARLAEPLSGTALSPAEQKWNEAQRTRPAFHSASPQLALRRVLREFGLAGARIGVDDAEITNWLVRDGIPADRLVESANFFRKLRMVKSPVEIDRMRVAANLNADSARAAIARLQPGMRYEEIQAAFFSEVVQRGGRPQVLAAGMVGGLRQDVLVRHEPTMIDAVGSFDGYCGDFGRTFVCGAPSNRLEQRMKAVRQLVPATFDLVRPGKTYSQLVAEADEIVRKMNLPFKTGVGPHSVGMEHTDDAWREDVPFSRSADSMLEAGMTITLDMPAIESGWGSTHMESLILVTADGAEWLDRADDPLFELPA